MGKKNNITLFQILTCVASISILLFSASVKAAEHEHKAMPPIDLAAPGIYKTATFGLG